MTQSNEEIFKDMKEELVSSLAGILLDSGLGHGYSKKENLMFFVENLIDVASLRTMMVLEQKIRETNEE